MSTVNNPAFCPRAGVAQKRASSPELGENWERTKYNSRTGRPVRKSAGQKTVDPNYVDTIQAIDDGEFEEHAELVSSSSDEDAPCTTTTTKKKKKKLTAKKRKRTPSPQPPPLEPPHEDLPEIIDSEEEATLVEQAMPTLPTHASEGPPGVTLTFNVPPGFQGPLVISLDRAFLQQAQQAVCARPLPMPEPPLKRMGMAKGRQAREGFPAQCMAPRGRRIGFLDLPPELRNNIYRLLFVSQTSFDFWDPDNFSRGATLLATCRQINEEGCGILYAENSFRFTRNRSMRGQYWDAKTSEIGYKDMRRFLVGIGTKNLARLRDMTIIFEDSAPSSTPHLQTNEARRFVHDEQLLECLRIVGRHCQLRKIKLCFQGRRSLDESYTFNKFLEIIGRIKGDEVDIVRDPRSSWHQPLKITYPVKTTLLREMTRKKKLYVE